MFKNFMFLLSLSLVFYSCTKPCDSTNCPDGYTCVDGDCICIDCDLSEENNENGNPINVPSYRCESDVITYNGHTYDLVELDGRCWFAENLRTTKFSNGDDIPEEVVINNWSVNSHQPMFIDSWAYTNMQGVNGKLYNGYSVVDERNICPSDWHVSTDFEWMELEMLIGVPVEEINIRGHNRAPGYRDIIAGEDIFGEDQLSMNLNSTGTIGNCDISEFHDGVPMWSYYWTSTFRDGTNSLYTRNFTDHNNNVIGRADMNLGWGYAVRCVKD